MCTILYIFVSFFLVIQYSLDTEFSTSTNIVLEMINTFIWPYVTLNSLRIFTNKPNLDKYIQRFCIIRIALLSILNLFFIDKVGIIDAAICFLVMASINSILNEQGYYKEIREKKKLIKMYKNSTSKLTEENKEKVNRLKNKEQLIFEIDHALKTTKVDSKINYIPKDLLKAYKEFDIIYIIFVFQYVCSLFFHINIIMYILGFNYYNFRLYLYKKI